MTQWLISDLVGQSTLIFYVCVGDIRVTDSTSLVFVNINHCARSILDASSSIDTVEEAVVESHMATQRAWGLGFGSGSAVGGLCRWLWKFELKRKRLWVPMGLSMGKKVYPLVGDGWVVGEKKITGLGDRCGKIFEVVTLSALVHAGDKTSGDAKSWVKRMIVKYVKDLFLEDCCSKIDMDPCVGIGIWYNVLEKSIIKVCESNTGYNWERIAGRPAVASRGRGMGERASRGGGRTGGRSGDQGNGRNDGQGGRVAQVGDQGRGQGNGWNQNGDAINDNIRGDVRNVIENNDRRGCTYKEFLACNPKEYDGKGGAVVYTHWIKKMESIHDMSGCEDNQKVKYTVGSFVCKALSWWNSQIRTLGREVAIGMS
ncbi:hypothetical protein Tco_0910727 [Tanacetum coccineum]|uniref:Reverse transcriptase domain-containing protein n=1 Tax=Tanacetum coccineum TaxID=301880 RepID=A0ABQ5CWC3_9ASTR